MAPLPFIRRARGFVPDPIDLGADGPSVLAHGADLKNTITLTRGREAFVSQYLGDLDNRSTIRFREETIRHLKSILCIEPEIVACDLHPDFISTRSAEVSRLKIVAVQHHVAHVAATAAEAGWLGRRARRRARRLWLRRRRRLVGRRADCSRRRAIGAVSAPWRRSRCPAATRRRASRGAWAWPCWQSSAAATRRRGFSPTIPEAARLAQALKRGARTPSHDQPRPVV